MEGTDLAIAEIRKEAFDFGRFLSAAENGRTGKYDAEKLMKYMEDKFKFEKGEFTFVTDSTDVENKKIHFNCDMVNETNETIKWDGDIEEDIIEGKIFWIKKDKKTKSDVIKKSFSFNGGIQKKR